MSASGRRRVVISAVVLIVITVGVASVLAARIREPAPVHSGAGSFRIGVLGDSDSHSYRDTERGVRRGGEFHDVTHQWTDVLVQTRGAFIDPGPLEVWGSRGITARMRARLGLEARSPRKLDYRYNYALSGARCASLNSRWPQQTRWLLSALRADPAAWAEGVVVIKIGVNDLGQTRHHEEYARTGLNAAVRATIDSCAAEIMRSVDQIRAAAPHVRVLVVGVADDSSWPPDATPWRSPEETARIRAVLDLFDETLRAELATRPGTAFMDDRTWYYDHWAGRDSAGYARLSSRTLGGAAAVTNTRGDAPVNLMLADGHAGTVAGGFWARELIRALNRAFGTAIPPLLDAEIARLADPQGGHGIAAPPLPAGSPPPVLELEFGDLQFHHAALPARLPRFSARDALGADVTTTATASLTNERGTTLPLFGDGAELELRAERHMPGSYRLIVGVQDAAGRRTTATVRVTIR